MFLLWAPIKHSMQQHFVSSKCCIKTPNFPLVLKYEKKQLVSSALTPINSSQATINTEIQAAQLVDPEATPEILLLMSVGFVM